MASPKEQTLSVLKFLERKDDVLIITLGDPLSINVELVTSFLASKESRELTQVMPLILIGSLWHFQHQEKILHGKATSMQILFDISKQVKPGLWFLDTGGPTMDPLTLTEDERGMISVRALYALKDLPLKPSQKLAVLTCPIYKNLCHKVGFIYDGHTEFFEDLWGKKALMLLLGNKLKVGLVTNHMALSQVAEHCTQEKIEQKIHLLKEGLQNIFHIKKPKIAICGLNPHCGDAGRFGYEEKRVIQPAIDAYISRHHDVEIVGPLPADTVFFFALQGLYDAVLAMYHDQGLGPFKTIHFDDGVNLSVGLPYLRVSPDHGPAGSLFLKKKASSRSFMACIEIINSYFFR